MTAGEVSCPRFRIGVIFSRYPPALFTIRLRFRRCCVLLRLNLLQGLPVLIHIGRVEQNDLPDHFGSLVIFSAFYEHFTDYIKLLYGLSPAEVNRLNNQALVGYYLEAWRRWN